MKTSTRLLRFMACICILAACSKDNDFFGDDQNDLKYNSEKFCNTNHGLDQDRYLVMRSTGLKVHYRIIGKGPIDMVFIPGWTNPLEVFTKQFDYFRDKARCIYIDVPGQGLSDAPEGIQFTMGLMADAIYEVVKKEGVKRFVGVGFSMGPVPLGQFELKHPGMITKLVNLDGSFYPWPPVGDPNRDQFIAETDGFCDWIETWGVEEKQWFGSLLVSDSSPEDLKEFCEYFFEFPSWLMANIYRNYTREEVNQPVGWTFPILSIYSAEPLNAEYEQLYFPDADIHVIEGGHVVQWEKYEIVNQLIWKFVTTPPGKRYGHHWQFDNNPGMRYGHHGGFKR